MPRPVAYEVTGSAAHDRIAPLLPKSWIDGTNIKKTRDTHPSTSNARSDDCKIAEKRSDHTIPQFLWENVYNCHGTRSYRDKVRCYSHLPNGSILDDKWALSRMLSSTRSGSSSTRAQLVQPAAILDSHCFRGLEGFSEFCDVVGMHKDSSQNETLGCDQQDGAFFDLVDLQQQRQSEPVTMPSKPSNLWVVKDANSNGAGGVWVVSPSNAHKFSDPNLSPLIEAHRYVAQEYTWPPVLYERRKCHVRVYALFTSDGRAYVHKRAFLHVANEIFTYDVASEGGNEENASVHITNCCANSDDKEKFAGEICVDFESDNSCHESENGAVMSLAQFFPSVCASVRTLAETAQPFVQGGEGNGCFEYLGLDFILSYAPMSPHSQKFVPVAYLLEVNAPPSQDTATGLTHAEDLHDEVIHDIISLWVLPCIEDALPVAGGWRLAHERASASEQQIECTPRKTSDTPMGCMSKTSFFNKMRWAMFERKCVKVQNELWAKLIADGNKVDHIVEFARSAFPYFSAGNTDSLENTSPPIFIENAGGSQVPSVVINVVSDSLSCRHRERIGSHTKALARRTLLTLLGASANSHKLFLGCNATNLLSTLANKYSQILTKDDEIVLAEHNHDANLLPWIEVARNSGSKVRWWKLDSTSSINSNGEDAGLPSCLVKLREVLTPATRIVVMAHASNILGRVYDLKELCDFVKDITNGRAHVIVDGVTAAPHRAPAVAETGVDWYVVSCHKLFGPHLGGLCGKNSAIEEIQKSALSPEDGNTSSIDVASDKLYRSWEFGTVNIEACAGVDALGTYFTNLATFSTSSLYYRKIGKTDHNDINRNFNRGWKNALNGTIYLSGGHVHEAYRRIQAAEMPLVNTLLHQFRQYSHVQIIEEPEVDNSKRLPIFSFVHAKLKSSIIVATCESNGIICRHGSFLSSRIFNAFDESSVDNNEVEEGFVRVSFVHYNTEEEVKRLIKVLEAMEGWF